MSKSVISTNGITVASRSRHWHEAIAGTYFPLELTFGKPETFDGELTIWDLGVLSLSKLRSQPLKYDRLPRHVSKETEEQFLITVPERSEISFSQCGTEVRCNPGGFIVERSHEPYEFTHTQAADLWVIKIDGKALGSRIRSPDRFCSLQFDATSGAGGLFIDMLRLIPKRFDTMGEESRLAVGQQLTDLLVLSLQEDDRTLTSGGSSVREAHLTRIESVVRRSLHDPGLDPDQIASRCGISTRYLHQLFRDTNQTLGQWIRDQRLNACREALSDPSNKQTISEIAYSFGFSDHAQFSRAFRNQFGFSPKDFRSMN